MLINCEALKPPVGYPSREIKHGIKDSEGNMFNQIFKEIVQQQKHPGGLRLVHEWFSFIPPWITQTMYRQVSNIRRTKSQTWKILVPSCGCLCRIPWSQMLSREWRCSWSSAGRRCSNYIWVIDNFIAYSGESYIKDFTVFFKYSKSKSTSDYARIYCVLITSWKQPKINQFTPNVVYNKKWNA